MTAVVANKRLGPETYIAAEAIDGGQLVVADPATKKVRVAGAGSALVLGVALYPAAPLGTTGGDGTGTGGNPSFDYSGLQEDVAVAWTGVYKLKASEAINWGDLVQSAALGQVALLGAGTLNLVVAQCVDPDGVTAGAWGFFRLRLG